MSLFSNIGLALKLWKIVGPAYKTYSAREDTMKSGWKTSEFWVTIGMVTAAVQQGLATMGDNAVVGAICLGLGALSAAAYAISRGMAKSKPPA